MADLPDNVAELEQELQLEPEPEREGRSRRAFNDRLNEDLPLPLPMRFRERMVPTEYERRSCAGMGPRIRSMHIQQARQDPKVALGDELSAAASVGNAEKVRSLLERGANPNHVHFQVNSDVPLARTSNVEVAQALLEHPNIDVNVQDINDLSILDNFVLHKGKNPALTAALLAHPKLIPDNKALKTAVRFACLETIELLLNHPGFHLNDPEVGVLHSAISRTKPNAVEIFEWLLNRKDLDVNLHLRETSTKASFGGHAGATALHRACVMDSLCIDIGQTERGVKTAVAERQATMLQMLLQRPDLDVNAVDAKGATALHWYASAGRLDLVKILLADPRSVPSLWHRNAEGLSCAEVAAAERDKQRPRWDPAPLLAQYQAVIDLLAQHVEEKKAEIEGCCPSALANHPGTWSMAVGAL